MELKFVDPRALKENPDKARHSKSSPQADALLLATIRAVGIVQPPVVAPETDGGNGYVIDAGHRRVKQSIAAGLEEIAVLVIERAEDGGAMRSLAETLAHEQLLGSVSQLSCLVRMAVMVPGDTGGAYRGRHVDVRVKRSRSVARTTLDAAATPQAI
ncbi:hypothetical protein MesoLjLa_64130 (plasmid) [Mesorhizobium sp. L-2-11]|nr:hypothetical protein MesoLjLa_64130 [Mesorhizobium sp. L-2-11]